MTARVRFAPSPTGFLHVGGARTALFNWLFARRHNGVFIVRVEDTDTARERPEFRAEIFAALTWLGLDHDEGPERGGTFGPYAQSERGAHYAAALAGLQAQDAVYPCFCPPGDAAEFAKPRCLCRALPEAERRARAADLELAPPLRMHVDSSVAIEIDDLVRGRVTFPPGEIEPFLITKAGNAPLYNFAAVVDDAAMEISHVIRGEEHLANTPKQLILYRACNLPIPQFAHLPIILNPQRHKLSKRDGAAAVSDYRKSGYLPEALRNFLALLGWSPGQNREILSLDEMIAEFDLARVQKSGAVFDQVKLTWINGEYIRRAPLSQIISEVRAIITARGDTADLRLDDAHLQAVCGLLQERVKTLAEIAEQRYLFSQAAILDWDGPAVAKRAGDAAAHERLRETRVALQAVTVYDPAELEVAIRSLAERMGAKAGDFIGPLRVAISGSAISPGIFELCAVLGRELVDARIDAFLHAFAKDEMNKT